MLVSIAVRMEKHRKLLLAVGSVVAQSSMVRLAMLAVLRFARDLESGGAS